MSNTVRYIPKLNDRDVIRAYRRVAEKFSDKSPVLVFNDNFGQLSDADLETYEKTPSYHLNSASLRVGPLSWVWSRLRANQNDANSALYDTQNLSWNQNQGNADRGIIASISAALDAALAKPLVAVGKADDTSSYLHSQKEVLGALESAVTEVLVNASKHRQDLDSEYIKREHALSEKVEDLRQGELTRIEEKERRLEAEISDRKEALDKRELELNALQKKLDDRNNTHVRREIRSSLLQLAKERLANFSVSRQTQIQYWAVHIVSLVGIFGLSAASLRYGSELISATSEGKIPVLSIALAFKSGLLAVAAITLGAWYLKWLNRWLQRIADAEFKLQQFRLDIERASWLAETVLEWKASATEPFPELLTTRLSTGLFQSSPSEIEDPRTPAAHLANALFGAAASARIKVGDQELVLDRKSISALRSD